MNLAQHLRLLRRANDVARQALAKGRHPFGAILVAADGETVLLEQGNVDTVNHAEAVIARVAAHRYDAATLWGCTLVTTVEPCAMCAATQYWAHIGKLLYGMSEERLLQLTGNHAENPTLNLPCRSVFASCIFIASWPAPLGMRNTGSCSDCTAASQRCCQAG